MLNRQLLPFFFSSFLGHSRMHQKISIHFLSSGSHTSATQLSKSWWKTCESACQFIPLGHSCWIIWHVLVIEGKCDKSLPSQRWRNIKIPDVTDRVRTSLFRKPLCPASNVRTLPCSQKYCKEATPTTAHQPPIRFNLSQHPPITRSLS